MSSYPKGPCFGSSPAKPLTVEMGSIVAFSYVTPSCLLMYAVEMFIVIVR
jgi:hypothetical protein